MLSSSLLSDWRQRSALLAAGLCLASMAAWSASPTESIRQALQTGQLEQAFKLLQQERQNSPHSTELRFLEGVVLAQQGQTDKAIESFRKLVESHPGIVEAHNNLGVLYASKGKLEEARKALEAGLHAHASFAALHRNLGDVQGQLTRQTYAKALQVDGKNRLPAPQLSLLGTMETPAPGSGPRLPHGAAATPVAAPAAAPEPPKAPASTPPPAALPAAPKPAPAVPPPAVAQPAPESASGPKPPGEKPVREDPAEVDAARAAVQAWAKAWSRKDMDSYLRAYADSFTPSDRQSRNKWEADRRLRILSKRSISVELRQIRIQVDGKTATAQFQQIYTSDNFTGNSRKTLEMVKQGSRWLITRETVH